jgi:spore coat protein U-like protein
MTIKNLKSSLLICSALLLSSTNNTFAATASGSIAASGTAVGTCTVTASTMAFGTLNFGSTKTATSTITPSCTLGVNYTVTNSANTNTLITNGGSVSADQILFPITITSNGSGGSAGAAFTLTNAAAGYISGVGTGGASSLGLSTLTGTAESASSKTIGDYTATVTLTITY